MKRITLFFASLFFLALAACGGAHATPLPSVVVNAPGTVVFGISTALVVKKDTLSGNRVSIRYSGGWQYLIDDAAWTKYGKVVTALGTSGLAANDSVGTVINVAASNGVYCQSNQSTIAFSTVAQSEVLNDGCAFWQALKAVSN